VGKKAFVAGKATGGNGGPGEIQVRIDFKQKEQGSGGHRRVEATGRSLRNERKAYLGIKPPKKLSGYTPITNWGGEYIRPGHR